LAKLLLAMRFSSYIILHESIIFTLFT